MKYKNEYLAAVRTINGMKALPMRKESAPNIPEVPGVYVVTDHVNEEPVVIYVGRTTTGNLRARLTSYHLSGAPSSARIKKGLMETGVCADNPEARKYLEEHCFVRFVQVPNEQIRRFMEHFLIAYFTPTLNR
ncbi:hypothetical protein [Marinobacter sp. C2H3]|uniref:hypothetical protein n=1 Tax=Marinobacter sp. C2H3 TaxID=3119003 RepID=UPI00300EDE0B